MKNRLPLLRHYIGAVRNTLPYSYLIDWADEQLLQGHYDDNIIALACATTHEQAIAAAKNLLGISLSSHDPFLPPIAAFTQIAALSDVAGITEYQVDRVLIYCPSTVNGEFTPYMSWITEIYAATFIIKQHIALTIARHISCNHGNTVVRRAAWMKSSMYKRLLSSPQRNIAILHLHVGLEEFTDCGLPQWHCDLNLVICRRTGTIRITSSDSDANK